MSKQLVNSSNLYSVEYNKETKTLEVEFNKGGVYQYSNVPESVFNQLMTAPSKGSYFYHNIRDQYDTKKIR